VIAGGILVAVPGAHRWATFHVSHYTGATPVSIDCAACHLTARGGTIEDRLRRPRYRSPVAIAVAPDGRRLYVTASDAGLLLVVEIASRRVVAEIPAGRRPHAVALDAAGRRAFVTDRDDDVVTILDLGRGAVTTRVAVGRGPAGAALSADGSRLFVAHAVGGDIGIVDTVDRGERGRIAADGSPYAVATGPAGAGETAAGRVLVTSLIAGLPQGGSPVGEVAEIDARSGRVARRWRLPGAHLIEGAAFLPDGTAAIVTLVRPKNLVPALQIERGWMMTNGLGLLDLATGEAVQVPIDDVDRFYADPSDVVVTPDGQTAFVSHGGVDTISVVDVPALRRLIAATPAADRPRLANRLVVGSRYVAGRIPTGANPRGLALSPDGGTLFVAERLDDTVGVIDVERLERVGRIDLGGPRHITAARRGERVFNSARATLQQQFSCRSCHPDNHVDGLQYDFEPDGLGRNVVDNRTLLGLDRTAPFKWNGRNTSLYMQCGIRFARFLTRSAPFPFEDQVALAAFLQSLPPPRPRAGADGVDEARERGREIFERTATRTGAAIPAGQRCITCHPAGTFTDRIGHDVGSASPTDSERSFDTPQLQGLARTAPYLHDGRARTLEEIWTLYSPNDEHGVTGDLGKQGLNDLIEYLRSL
jgi:YVTN family beta-propeller protein